MSYLHPIVIDDDSSLEGNNNDGISWERLFDGVDTYYVREEVLKAHLDGVRSYIRREAKKVIRVAQHSQKKSPWSLEIPVWIPPLLDEDGKYVPTWLLCRQTIRID